MEEGKDKKTNSPVGEATRTVNQREVLSTVEHNSWMMV